MAKKRNPLADFVIGAASGASQSIPAAAQIIANQPQKDLANIIALSTLGTTFDTNYTTKLKAYNDAVKDFGLERANKQFGGPPQKTTLFNVPSSDDETTTPPTDTETSTPGEEVSNTNTSNQPIEETKPKTGYQLKLNLLNQQKTNGEITSDNYTKEVEKLSLVNSNNAKLKANLDAGLVLQTKIDSFLNEVTGKEDLLAPNKFEGGHISFGPGGGIDFPGTFQVGELVQGISKVFGGTHKGGSVEEAKIFDSYKELVDALADFKTGGDAQARSTTREAARNLVPNINQDKFKFIPDARGFLRDITKEVKNLYSQADKNGIDLSGYEDLNDDRFLYHQYVADPETTDYSNPEQVQTMVDQGRISPADAANGIDKALRKNPEVPTTIQQKQMMGTPSVSPTVSPTPSPTSSPTPEMSPLEKKIQTMMEQGIEVPMGEGPNDLMNNLGVTPPPPMPSPTVNPNVKPSREQELWKMLGF